MNPEEIREQYRNCDIDFVYAIKLLMQHGFTQLAAEEYLFS